MLISREESGQQGLTWGGSLCCLNVWANVQRLALTTAISALAATGLTTIATKTALAEFDIQETQVEKGEVEVEYRGCCPLGLPKAEKEEEAAPCAARRRGSGPVAGRSI